MIERKLRKPNIIQRNIYNIDKIRIILSILGSIKVLIGKDDIRDYKGIHIKRTTVITIEYILAANESLKPMII